jgi:hypothetical protein
LNGIWNNEIKNKLTNYGSELGSKAKKKRTPNGVRFFFGEIWLVMEKYFQLLQSVIDMLSCRCDNVIKGNKI